MIVCIAVTKVTFLYEKKWYKSTTNTNQLCLPTTRTDNLHSQTDQSTELIQISRIKIKEKDILYKISKITLRE